jgi:signal transduction histidine kinase/ActR/RegA family two-component response regulator
MLSVLALGFAVLMGVSTLVERQVERDLALIQERFIPLIALGPKLEQGFERLRRAFSDAVAAQDVDALNETGMLKSELLRTLQRGRKAIHEDHARALAREIDAYYVLASDVSHRLLSGESGPQLRSAMLTMQEKHAAVLTLLRGATALDHDALASAFAEASGAQRTATRVRLVVSFGSLGVVLILSFLISRGLLHALSELGAGFARFGRGDFSVRIREQGDQELLQLARQANQMAESLQRIGTERDRQQEKLQQMNAELSARTAELSSVSNYKSQFLANMSHELRTPLNSMLVLSGLLADNETGNLTEKQVEFCKTIHAAGTDLLALINQVLDLAKIESGKQDVNVSAVLLNELADHARRIFEPLARDKDLSFTVSVDASLPPQITSDRRRIEQILNNLLGNAIKFTERGEVTLRFLSPAPDVVLASGAAALDATLAIEIEDTGAGIPREHHGRIFAAFEQLDASADRRYGGTGLGLSIARELAVLLGGEIQLRSAPGRGSVFTCYLPFAFQGDTGAVRPAAKAREPTRELGPASTAPSDVRGSVRGPNLDDSAMAMLSTRPANLFDGASILVVEDDMRTLYALSALLHAKGAEVLTADTAESALEELERHPQARAVLLDLMMPEQNAHEALQRIRAQSRFSQLPVIALTNHAAAGEREALRRAGVSDLLEKPVDADALCALLCQVLQRGLPCAGARSA